MPMKTKTLSSKKQESRLELIRELEQARKEIRAGKFITMEQLKKELKIK